MPRPSSDFSALQRAEIAEIACITRILLPPAHFSALQRAEIAEIGSLSRAILDVGYFSALQRAEIAEIGRRCGCCGDNAAISVLFNEPKLLKSPS